MLLLEFNYCIFRLSLWLSQFQAIFMSFVFIQVDCLERYCILLTLVCVCVCVCVGGGGAWVFGTSNWHPIRKKIFPKMDTPS